MNGRPVRCAVHSDRHVLRDALGRLLDNRPEFLVVGETGGFGSLDRLCELRRPDLVLVETGRLTVEYVEGVGRVRRRFPRVRFVVTYADADDAALVSAARAGLSSLVPGSRGLAGVLFELHRHVGPTRVTSRDGATYTARELEIVSLLGSGRTVAEIAEWLRISPHTVDNVKRRVFAKLGVANQVHAVSRAAALGLIAVDGSVRARSRGAEPGHSLLAVVTGPAGPALDDVLRTLVAHGLPVVRAGRPRLTARDHWASWHRGPLVAVLVSPCPADWLLAAALGAAPVVVSPGEPGPAAVMDAVVRGARAIVPVEDVPTDLARVLTAVAHGYSAMPADLLDDLVGRVRVRLGEGAAAVPRLTARERDILASIGDGATVRETADALGIAVKTVENIQARLFRKLAVHNRSAALTVARQLGLADAAGPGTRVR